MRPAGTRKKPPWPGEEGVEFHFDGTGFSDFFEQFFGRGSRFDGANDFASHGVRIGGGSWFRASRE